MQHIWRITTTESRRRNRYSLVEEQAFFQKPNALKRRKLPNVGNRKIESRKTAFAPKTKPYKRRRKVTNFICF
jgi:hypothetical protein